MAQRLMFTGKQEVAQEDFSLPPVQPGQVSVKTLYTLMSTGTENIIFNRLFADGGHWDQWVKYPFYPGYSATGTIVETGPDVTGLQIGDRVAFRGTHASAHVLDAGGCIPLPDGLDAADASWFALAKIAQAGARAARYRLGDSVAVIGGGPIGQMSARWALAAGAGSVTLIDPVEARLAFAPQAEVTTLSCSLAEAAEVFRAAPGGRPRVVIEGTGHAPVFAQALGLAADRGTVVLLGDTGSPQEQRLSADVVLRGLRIIGAHDSHNDNGWGDAESARLFFRLAAAGRFPLAGLNTHTFRPEQCAEAYATANQRRGETMGIGFDWTHSEDAQ